MQKRPPQCQVALTFTVSAAAAYLDPFLRLLERGVCGRLARSVMLMRRSDACNRTCHWRGGGSALQL